MDDSKANAAIIDAVAIVAAALLAVIVWNDVRNVVASAVVGGVPTYAVDWVSCNLAVVYLHCEWN